MKGAVIVALILANALICALIVTAVKTRPPAPAILAHHFKWELDPQGQAENPGREDCKPPRIPFYIDLPDGSQFYLECLRHD